MTRTYEVRLFDRKSGDYIETIHSGSNFDMAYDVAEKYNMENVSDYDCKKEFHKYVDGKSDGLCAILDYYEDGNKTFEGTYSFECNMDED